MQYMSHLSKIVIASVFIIAAPLTMANDDCVKPKVKGYSADEMSCIGEGLVLSWSDKGDIVFDKNGKTIIPVGRYEAIFHATNGLIGVADTRNDEFRVGFISQSTGKEVIPLQYMSTGHHDIGVNSFSEGLVLMQKPSQKWGYLNNTGETIIPFIYDSAEDFSEGLAAVSKGEYENSKHGFIDKTGKIVIPFDYDYAGNFSEGLATFRKGSQETGKYGVIDKNGKTIVPAKYDGYIAGFSEGMAAVHNKEEKYGFIDRSGKLVIPYKYNIEYEGETSSFSNGKTNVTDDKGEYCINKKGAKVTC